MLTLASCLNSSPLRCGLVPAPDEAKDSLPGLARASAISSGTVFAWRSRRVIRRFGTDHSMAMPVKSFAGSNGSLAYSVGAIAWLAMV